MRLASVHTYPIKSGHRLDHERVDVSSWGLAGDRRWLVLDAETGRVLTQRDEPRLARIRPTPLADGRLVVRTDLNPDELVVPQPVDGEPANGDPQGSGALARRAGVEADAWLSRVLDRKLSLVWLDDSARRPGEAAGFVEGYPVLLANHASLAVLNDWIIESDPFAEPVPMTRFRPNLAVTGAPAWAEDELLGARVRIGGATFAVVKPCARCVITTTDQQTGERGREPLRTLARHRRVGHELLFAVNLVPLGAGTVAAGDPVLRL
jgi:uncharacterized protein